MELRSVPVVEVGKTPERWERLRPGLREPVLVRGLPSDLANGASEWLVGAAGHRSVPVQYSVRRVARLDPRVNAGNYLRTFMPLADALRAVQETPVRGLTHVLAGVDISHWLPELDHELLVPPMLDRERCSGPYLFVGGDGTGTTLHYDPTDNYLRVLAGAKEVVLAPPGHLRLLGAPPLWQPYCGVSRRGDRAVEELPVVYRCRVEPGELLVVPRNWWHGVQNHGYTIAVSLSPAWPGWSVLRWRQARVVARLRFEDWIAARPALADRLDGAVIRWGRRPVSR